MKRYSSITILITSVVLLLMLIQTGTSAAYQFAWEVIQHRVNESGVPLNRLAFEIQEDSGDYVASASVVTGVILRPPLPNGDPDPTGTPVNLTPLKFSPPYDYYRSSFNTTNSAWKYDTPLSLSDFEADITDPLIIGTYTLEVSMISGPTLIKEIDFDFLLDLPIISSRTFQIHTDTAGNLYWTWDVPKELLTLAKTYDLEIRPGVVAMVSGEMVALYFPSVSVEMGFSFAPSSIYQDLVSRADVIRFGFSVRSRNNNARSYSNRIDVQDLSSPVSIIPKKNVVVVPLM